MKKFLILLILFFIPLLSISQKFDQFILASKKYPLNSIDIYKGFSSAISFEYSRYLEPNYSNRDLIGFSVGYGYSASKDQNKFIFATKAAKINKKRTRAIIYQMGPIFYNNFKEFDLQIGLGIDYIRKIRFTGRINLIQLINQDYNESDWFDLGIGFSFD